MTNKLMQRNALPATAFPLGNPDWVLGTLVRERRPVLPLYVVYPERIAEAARQFISLFPGTAAFAVKTNPDITVMQSLLQGGIKAFDVASLEEIKLVRSHSPTAELHFMHPVKMPEHIRAAYFDYGVRHFVLDHEEELYKIMRETDLAQDLNLTVRIALPKNDSALIDFSAKFGASYKEALELLEMCRPVSKVLGISFHVGTQSTDPESWRRAISYAAKLIKTSDVPVDSLNVGGGFPVPYVGDSLSSLEEYMQTITETLNEEKLSHLELMAEPGRVLVAKGAQLVTRVELCKEKRLYINDGVYGGLFDAASWVGTQYPVTAISSDRPFDGDMDDYTLAGPTCDSLDMMAGPFNLPADIGMGDWIVFNNVGAYSQTLRSDFNGFGHADKVCIYSEEGK
ncbi:MAG: hypothetical protein CMP91_04530 [Gammaproteobacteria bacterium]|nr:hypothetical protein [Gammaproteobacteria bacterium]|tara:strand:- start:384242 stop:385435 length:1194 start_codon:yes stop_codon:yes gene_type:complete